MRQTALFLSKAGLIAGDRCGGRPEWLVKLLFGYPPGTSMSDFNLTLTKKTLTTLVDKRAAPSQVG